jgi:hypothetical protein
MALYLRTVALAALLGLGLAAVPAQAATGPVIRDEAKLFSADAKQRRL